ncbi:MAG: DUF2971 domain-containing protein [Oceanospirillales bacterium]|nr:DUF2971 domain-containing protein [Oceanospirillales bacterium]
MIFERLYKFHSISVNSLSALATGSAWFSSQASLNDPFEGISTIVAPISHDEKVTKSVKFLATMFEKQLKMSPTDAHQLALKQYMNDPEYILEQVEIQAKKGSNLALNYARDIGIYSTASDIPGDERTQAANMLLWSHYSNGLRGFCIQFDARRLYESLQGENQDSKFAWAKVDYVNKPHEIDMFSFVENSNFDYLKQLQKKHEQWCYECECRIVSNKVGLQKYCPSAIEKIYVGEKISEAEEHLLLTVLERHYPQVEIFKVKVDDESYGIKLGKKI